MDQELTASVRTRFAPSPTGMMHVGNLRTALYAYLLAKSKGGSFILRIEDTDRTRMVDQAVEVIYKTLDAAGLKHDEGPDVGGPCGPYVQSERQAAGIYMKYAKMLVEKGAAYLHPAEVESIGSSVLVHIRQRLFRQQHRRRSRRWLTRLFLRHFCWL